ncbi:MAG: hypothetical protein ACOYB1_16670 [Limnohabitans sp.]
MLPSRLRSLAERLKHGLVSRWHENLHELKAVLDPTSGVTGQKREQELVVSLTTIPERICKVHLCIESLLRQSLKPDRIVLWLSESAVEGRPTVSLQSLPWKLRRLEKRGLEIRWCRDIRSLRKIVPTLRLYPGALIVTSDDDVFYPRDWLKDLYAAYMSEPQFIHCHRAHLMRYAESGAVLPYVQWNITAPGLIGPSMKLFPTGVGGVLYAPDHLHSDVFNEEVFLELCPTADDVWLKAMSMLKGTACKKVGPHAIAYPEIRIPNNRVLSHDNINSNGNDVQISRVAQRYHVFNESLQASVAARPGVHGQRAGAVDALADSPHKEMKYRDG